MTDFKDTNTEIHAYRDPAAAAVPLPEKFTNPFRYVPHPLCLMAAAEVQDYLAARTDWADELRGGKMFGVLAVRTADGTLGYLAAFSGLLAGTNRHPFFVPPVYDLLRPGGFFRTEEAAISVLNARTEALLGSPAYVEARRRAEDYERQSALELAGKKADFRAAREARRARRAAGPLDEAERAALERESQFQKAELKRMERARRERSEALRAVFAPIDRQAEALKAERRNRSAALQRRLFRQFRLLNALGEVRDLCDIFAGTVQREPPAGAGECAAPKLLQHAYLRGLTPVAMAEFWWGGSPSTEIRHHGCFYPACKGKCGPILAHMLRGLDVDDPATDGPPPAADSLRTVYEDDCLVVVDKPAGMLSVPGKGEEDSACAILRRRYPEATGPLLVHRLDMATSGLLLAAKTKEAHQHLQAQFKNRTVKKCYVAVLDGTIPCDGGIVDLPLRPDPFDRPRQVADREHGKPAVTYYEVRAHRNRTTLVAFRPLTGRTHQLRVHAAHPDGLGCPILGDELYGRRAARLYLHAESLEFVHPVSGEIVKVFRKADFC